MSTLRASIARRPVVTFGYGGGRKRDPSSVLVCVSISVLAAAATLAVVPNAVLVATVPTMSCEISVVSAKFTANVSANASLATNVVATNVCAINVIPPAVMSLSVVPNEVLQLNVEGEQC